MGHQDGSTGVPWLLCPPGPSSPGSLSPAVPLRGGGTPWTRLLGASRKASWDLPKGGDRVRSGRFSTPAARAGALGSARPPGVGGGVGNEHEFQLQPWLLPKMLTQTHHAGRRPPRHRPSPTTGKGESGHGIRGSAARGGRHCQQDGGRSGADDGTNRARRPRKSEIVLGYEKAVKFQISSQYEGTWKKKRVPMWR